MFWPACERISSGTHARLTQTKKTKNTRKHDFSNVFKPWMPIRYVLGCLSNMQNRNCQSIALCGFAVIGSRRRRFSGFLAKYNGPQLLGVGQVGCVLGGRLAFARAGGLVLACGLVGLSKGLPDTTQSCSQGCFNCNLYNLMS